MIQGISEQVVVTDPADVEIIQNFILYRLDVLRALSGAGIFAMANGSMILNFDHLGILQSIKKDIMAYKRVDPLKKRRIM
jgi:hypothetical protein